MNNIIGDVKRDPKPFWKNINSQKSDKQGIPPLQNKSKRIADTDVLKAEALNEQFFSVFCMNKYDSVPYSIPKVPSMPSISVTPKGVRELMKGLNVAKAMGPDQLHPHVLKSLRQRYAMCYAIYSNNPSIME